MTDNDIVIYDDHMNDNDNNKNKHVNDEKVNNKTYTECHMNKRKT